MRALFWLPFSRFCEFQTSYHTPSRMFEGVLSALVYCYLYSPRGTSPRNAYQDQRVLQLPLPYIPGSPVCPLTALRAYLANSLRPNQSPLFGCRSHGSFQPILAHQYSAFIKASVAAIGLEPKKYASHSFRRGGATFALACNALTAFIKTQEDWQSDAYLVYLQLSSSGLLLAAC